MPKGEAVGTQFALKPPNYEGPNRFMNWHGKRFEVGTGFSPFFLREVERRKGEIEACIVGVFGGAGRGKTYMALRQAEIIDEKFDPEIQVAFGPSEFLKLIGPDSPLNMGQVIVVDEAQFSAGSRNWYNEIQKDLMAHLEAVRSRGFIIFIIALNIATLDVIARNYTLTHMIYMKKRGQGVAYRFYSSPFGKEPYKNRLGVIYAKLPGCGECQHPSCLRCPHSGIARKNSGQLCNNTRVRYERKKREYLATQARASQEKRQDKEEKTEKVNYEALADSIGVEYHTLPKTKKTTQKDPEAVLDLLRKKTQRDYSLYVATRVRNICEKRIRSSALAGTPTV
jgi:hypothetical protein